ncbi:unnamed protein product [Rotaria sp. Silwood2]|nr:unnamed protein product [Rotaria sp. Silwood2]CAF3399959.1 unnamed protein product [Rotaria sp. Silwood2]CAF4364703.1 unnamed protein product [Rotaria sp. Silwood2]CAF4418054.1 unnamed protein product [Rotaria sp. Silwood2]CAF4553573.1 unnamed protein product [Rotaria sp. Silwood2]
MKSKTEIYALQIILAIMGSISLTMGVSGIWMGPNNMNKVTVPIRLDNHYRYLSGFVLGFGLTMWFYIIPRISQAVIIVRIFAFMVFMGGLARVVGLFKLGIMPDTFTLIAIIAELFFTPILCYWQARIAQRKDQ